ncbi:hypothetical protein BDV97DRAFT_105028 [Delphinella strobiligena]|nr:hypothetical protein BDV97DRAFT_105028 [Delphinella strobiligena]
MLQRYATAQYFRALLAFLVGLSTGIHTLLCYRSANSVTIFGRIPLRDTSRNFKHNGIWRDSHLELSKTTIQDEPNGRLHSGRQYRPAASGLRWSIKISLLVRISGTVGMAEEFYRVRNLARTSILLHVPYIIEKTLSGLC